MLVHVLFSVGIGAVDFDHSIPGSDGSDLYVSEALKMYCISCTLR
jgi:hypothetical protein